MRAPDPSAAPGLRQRKKDRTRTEIQAQALRLFRAQGFQATTVEQVAAAAEVAPSTVFRYFPRKEDLARLGDYHSLHDALVGAFRDQPAELTALSALRAALRSAFAGLEPADRSARRDRDVGLLESPELWSANVQTVRQGLEVITELVADRTGREVDDPAVRSLTAAVLGIGLEVVLRCSRQPELDPGAEIDHALAGLESAITI